MLTRTLRWCWIFRTAAGLGPVLCAPERRAPLAIRNRTAISRTVFRLPLGVLMAAGIVFLLVALPLTPGEKADGPPEGTRLRISYLRASAGQVLCAGRHDLCAR